MILSCDIGNSSSSFGIFEDAKYNPVETFRIDTEKISTEQDLKKFLSKNTAVKKLSGICISSVVPSANPIYENFFNKIKLKPFFYLARNKVKYNSLH